MRSRRTCAIRSSSSAARARLWDEDGNEYLDFLAGISRAQRRPLPPARGRGGPEQAARLTHVTNLYYTEPAMRLSRRCRRARSAARCFSATAAPRRTRRRSSSPAAPRPGGEIVVLHGGFHGRTYGRCRRRRRNPSRRRSRRSCPGSSSSPKDPHALGAAVDAATAAVLLEPIQGETGDPRARPTSC